MANKDLTNQIQLGEYTADDTGSLDYLNTPAIPNAEIDPSKTE